MTFTLADFRHAFAVRLAEWAFGCILTLWGVALLDTPIFDGPGGVYFIAIRHVVSQHQLAVLCLFSGGLRLAVLALNGAWRPMYYLRAWFALTSAVLWFSMSLGFFASGVPGPWFAVYPVLFVFDAVNCFRAAGDAARVEILRKAAVQAGALQNGRT